MKLSKNIEIQYSRNPLCNHNFQKKRDYNTMKLRVKLQWKKRDYYSKIDMDAKKQKKQFQNMKICDIFSKLATLFWNPIFFCKWKKKVVFRDKKNKNYATISTQFFQKYTSTDDFLKLRWNWTLKYSSFTETPWN